MPQATLTDVLRHLRRAFEVKAARDDSDRTLLQRFVASRDEPAFSVLAQRHGPMVLGVCLRLLGDAHAAEDAFQATFLVLSRRARSIRKKESVASWLFGVAQRIALKARSRAAARRKHEGQAMAKPSREPLDDLTWQELRGVLDEEIARLPEQCRAPIVLCYLEGKSYDQAAKELGWPKSSLASRLSRGRELLRQQLTRRGIGVSAAALATVLSEKALGAPVAALLTINTVKAAACVAVGRAVDGGLLSARALTLAQEAMKGMIAMKVKMVLVVAAVGLALGGVGFAGYVGMGEEGGKHSAKQPPLPQTPPMKIAKVGQEKKASPKGVDLYGDPLPEGAAMRLGTVRLRAAGANLAISADGKTLVGVRGGKFLSFWDVETGKLKETKEMFGASDSLGVLSTDGKWLTNSFRSALRLWDVQTGKLAHEFTIKGTSESSFWQPAFSQDGKQVATAWETASRTHQIRAWDLATGKETFARDITIESPGGLYTLCFMPDGKKLLASFGNSDAGTFCWDIATGQQLWQVKGFPSERRLLAFTPNGQLISPRRVLDLATGQPLKHDGLPPMDSASSIAVTPDGRMLLVATAKGILLWDLEANKELRLIEGAGEAMILAPDGNTLITSNGTLQRWDLATGKPLYPDNFGDGHAIEVTAIIVSADGKRLASSASDGSVRLWDLTTGQPVHVWRGHEATRPSNLMRWVYAGVQALDMTPDGRWIISAGSEGRIKVWDCVTGKESCTIPFPPLPPHESEPEIYHLRIAPDGSRATGFFGATLAKQIQGQPSPPSGRSIVTWDLKKGVLLSRVAPARFGGRYSTLARDGKTLLSGSSLVNLLTGQEIWRLDGSGGSIEQPTDISRNGSLIAGGSNLLKQTENKNVFSSSSDGFRIWEAASGKCVAHLPTKWNTGTILFHPNNRFLVVNGVDGINVWDLVAAKVVLSVNLPQKIRTRTNINAYASCLACTPDGRQLATGHPDGTMLLWNIDLPLPKPVPLAAQEIDALWMDLQDADAAKAWRAVWRLADSPAEVVPFLRDKSKPILGADAKTTGPLLDDLGSDTFAKREAAKKGLEGLGLLAEPALRERLKANPPLELKQRIEALLKGIAETPPALTPESLRDLRAVAVLSRIQSPEPRQLLEGLSKGVESAPLTSAAKAALQ